MTQGDPVVSPPAMAGERTGSHFRWYICGLLFYATTVNYMDRMVPGHFEADYRPRFGLDGDRLFGIDLRLSNRIRADDADCRAFDDWLGLRVGYPLAVLVWSLSSMAHAFAGVVAVYVGAAGAGIGRGGQFSSRPSRR